MWYLEIHNIHGSENFVPSEGEHYASVLVVS